MSRITIDAPDWLKNMRPNDNIELFALPYEYTSIDFKDRLNPLKDCFVFHIWDYCLQYNVTNKKATLFNFFEEDNSSIIHFLNSYDSFKSFLTFINHEIERKEGFMKVLKLKLNIGLLTFKLEKTVNKIYLYEASAHQTLVFIDGKFQENLCLSLKDSKDYVRYSCKTPHEVGNSGFFSKEGIIYESTSIITNSLNEEVLKLLNFVKNDFNKINQLFKDLISVEQIKRIVKKLDLEIEKYSSLNTIR